MRKYAGVCVWALIGLLWAGKGEFWAAIASKRVKNDKKLSDEIKKLMK